MCIGRLKTIIELFYNNEINNVHDEILQLGTSLHLCIDGQFDSPSFSAFHCTVTSIESLTKKVIDLQ